MRRTPSQRPPRQGVLGLRWARSKRTALLDQGGKDRLAGAVPRRPAARNQGRQGAHRRDEGRGIDAPQGYGEEQYAPPPLVARLELTRGDWAASTAFAPTYAATPACQKAARRVAQSDTLKSLPGGRRTVEVIQLSQRIKRGHDQELGARGQFQARSRMQIGAFSYLVAHD